MKELEEARGLKERMNKKGDTKAEEEIAAVGELEGIHGGVSRVDETTGSDKSPREVSKVIPLNHDGSPELVDGNAGNGACVLQTSEGLGRKDWTASKDAGYEGFAGRLQFILENRNRIGDPKVANDMVQWFRRKNRPPRPVDGLGTYKFAPVNLGGAFDYDQIALRKRIGGISTKDWERDGSVNVDFVWLVVGDWPD